MSAPPDAIEPLRGVRVVELGYLLPVPAVGANLARMGAEVTRVEPPGGDPGRRIYGGWLSEIYGADKRAVTVDLKRERDRMTKLLELADVVLTGFRPEAARRLGVDRESVRRTGARPIHCSIVGHPSGTPEESRPGHDLSFLAGSGALTEPATASAEGQPPRRPAMPVVDLAGAAVATQAVLGALIERQRSARAPAVEVSLQQVAVAWMIPRLGAAFDPAYGVALDPANDLYRCADDLWIALAAIEPKFWEALHDALAPAGTLPEGSRGWGSDQRIAARSTLVAAIGEAVESRSRGGLLAELTAAGCPADPVLTGAEASEKLGDGIEDWRRAAVPFNYLPIREEESE